MPNEVVDLIRAQFPDATKTLSDRELTLRVGDALRAQSDFSVESAFPTFRNDYLDYKVDRSPGLVADTTHAAAAGLLDVLPRINYGAAAAGFGALGLDTPRDFFLRQASRNAQEQADRTGAQGITRIEDVRGPGEFLRYALPTVATQLPQLGATVGATLVGTAIGSALGPAGAIEGGITGAGIAGGAIAAGLTSIAQNTGDIYSDLATRPDVGPDKALGPSLVAGTAGGLVDAIGAAIPVLRLTKAGSAVSKSLAKTALAKLAENVLERGGVRGAAATLFAEGATEGTTELIQEAINIAGEEHATGKQVPRDEVRSRLLNNFAAGAVTGGALGGLTGLRGHRAEVAPITEETSPAAPSVTAPSVFDSQLPTTNEEIQRQGQEEGVLAGEAVPPLDTSITQSQPPTSTTDTSAVQIEGAASLPSREEAISSEGVRPAYDQSAVQEAAAARPQEEVTPPPIPAISEIASGEQQAEVNPYRPTGGELVLPEAVARNVSPTEAPHVEEMLRATADPVAADAAYNAFPESFGGKVINADVSRNFLKAFAGSREGRIETTVATTPVANLYTGDRLFREVGNRGERKSLLLTGGGWGAGKSSILTNEKIAANDLVYDGTLRDTKLAIQTIQRALDKGWDVGIEYVQRPIDLVAKGVIARAQEHGRHVPLSQLAGVHEGAQRSIIAIAKHFENEPRVKISLFQNLGTQENPSTPHGIDLEDIDVGGKLSYQSPHDTNSRADPNQPNAPRAANDQSFVERATPLVHQAFAAAASGGQVDRPVLERLAGTDPALLGILAQAPLYSRPNYLLGALPMRAAWQRVANTLLSLGFDLRTTQALMGRVGGEFMATANGRRVVSVVMDNIFNPSETDVRVLTHEMVHGLETVASPAERESLRRAVERLWAGMSPEQRAEFESRNRSLQFDNPLTAARLARQGLTPEDVRWREALAVMLEGEGVAAAQAGSLAQRVWSTLKQIFLPIAQRLLNAMGYTVGADRIALSLFQDRLRSMLNREPARDLFTALGGRPLTRRDQALRFSVPPFMQGYRGLDSPGAVAMNVENSLTPIHLFSQPDDTPYRATIGAIDNPAAAIHQQIAAINYGRDLEIEAAKLAKVPVPILRQALRSPDLDLLRQAETQRIDPSTGQPVANVDPEYRIADFTAEATRSQAQRQALAHNQKIRASVARTQLEGSAEIERMDRRIEQANEVFLRAHERYLDRRFLGSVIYDDIRRTLTRERRVSDLKHQQYGEVVQQLRALDKSPAAEFNKAYGPVFSKLLTGTTIRPENLFDWMDAMVNTLSVDFTLPITDIRKHITDRLASYQEAPAQLGALIQATPESRALLATVVAYAKKNAAIVAKIEQRRIETAAERVKLQDELSRLVKEQGLSQSQALSDVRKAATLTERARSAFADRRAAIRSLENQRKLLVNRTEIAQAALPVFNAAENDLENALEIRPQMEFGDQMSYRVPNEKGVLITKELSLNSKREPTDAAQFRRDMEARAQWLEDQKNKGAIDETYRRVWAEQQALAQGGYIDNRIQKVNALYAELRVGSVGRVAASFGLPVGRLVNQAINVYMSIHRSLREIAHRKGQDFERARDEVVKVLHTSGRKLSYNEFYDMFFQPAASAFEKERGLLEQPGLTDEQRRSRVMQKVMGYYAGNEATAPYIKGREAAFGRAMLRFMEHAGETSKFWHDVPQQAPYNVGVADPSLKALDADGRMVAAVRKSIPQGVMTFSSGLSRRLKQITYQALIGAPATWTQMADLVKRLPELFTQGGEAAARTELAPYFANPEVWQGFIGAMARMETNSVFDAPVASDGVTRAEADPVKVLAAYQSAQPGAVVAFARAMYEAHGGTSDFTTYLADTIGRMESYFAEIARMQEEADGGPGSDGLRNLVREHAINGRVLERWPTEWREYHVFDRLTNDNIAARVAAEIAWGRDTAKLDNVWRTLETDVKANIAELEAIERQVPTGLGWRAKKKWVTQAYVARLGKKDGLARVDLLRTMRERLPLLDQSRRGLREHFASPSGDLGAARFGSQLLGTVVSWTLNTPATAFLQLSELFSPLIQSGFSRATLRQATRAWKFWGEDTGGSITQVVGLKLWRASRLRQLYNEMGLADPYIAARWLEKTENGWRSALLSDRGRRDEPEPATRLMRVLANSTNVGVNLLGDKAEYTTFRPLGFFNAENFKTQAANTLALWQRVEEEVVRVIDFLHANPEALSDAAFEADADTLGLKGLAKLSFEKLRIDMADEVGLNLTAMAKGAMERIDGLEGSGKLNALLSPQERVLLVGLSSKDITLDGSIATNNPRVMASGLLRTMMMLWGWPLRRGLQVLRAFRSPSGEGGPIATTWALLTGRLSGEEGRAALTVMGQGLLTIAAMSAGGMGLGLLLDAGYQEKILRKRRNLRTARELALALERGEAKEAFLSFLESTNRAGTFGILGEIANTAINATSGEGDNRALSLDQRVFAANAILSVARGLQGIIAQDGNITYPNVIRPIASSLGGNAVLQYMQLANRAFDLDNSESRYISRLNVQNWLRVVGRVGEMEVRKSQGGYSTPTPFTPYMTQMVLAAYGEDRAGFAESYRAAVAKAREMGKEDPQEYVRDSFRSRHPLRTVFTHLTTQEYSQLLGLLPEGGRDDVSAAVRLFNSFGSSIGVQPFTGSVGRSTTVSARGRDIFGLSTTRGSTGRGALTTTRAGLGF